MKTFLLKLIAYVILYVTVFIFNFIIVPDEVSSIDGIPVKIWWGWKAKLRKKVFRANYLTVLIFGKRVIYAHIKTKAHLQPGSLLHELAHIKYPPAIPPEGAPLGKFAHIGKGARFEHQADKFAVTRLLNGADRKLSIIFIHQFIRSIENSLDGDYRTKLIRRYLRRYYSIEL